MIGRWPAGGWKAAGVAGGTLVCHGHLRVAPLGGLPAIGVVAAYAIGAGQYVRRNLARGTTAVVATSAIGRAIESAVVRLGATEPCVGGLVAVLAYGHAIVNRRRWSCRQAEAAVEVAGRTLAGHGHIGMEGTGVPAGEAALVTAVAIGNGNPAERFVRNVVARQATGGRVAACVATAALASHRHLAVVPGCWLPARRGVTAGTVQRCRHVRAALARRGASVMAITAVGGAVEQAVIRL